MDSDATTLENAVAVLRRHHGEQLAGPRRRTEAQMRQTLQEQMGLDETTADRVLKKLLDTGRLTYVGSADVGTEPGTSTTGPVISMPLAETPEAGTPLITTASPAAIMGIVNEQGADVAASDVTVTGAGALSTDPIRGGDVGRKVAENNEGATMGQLGDTNVEAEPAPVTIGEHDEVEADRTHGYWRIG